MDPISDILSRIRNAQKVKKQEIFAPYSNTKFAIASVLQKEGYISLCKIEENKDRKKKEIKIVLKYGENKEPAIHEIKRISKPGQRIYSPKKYLPRVLEGLGILIVSTSRGVMSDREARKRNLGGEIICRVW